MTNQIDFGFAIITTTANELFQRMGVRRVPVILSIGRENDWLKLDKPLYGTLRMLDDYPAFEKLQQVDEPKRLPRRG